MAGRDPPRASEHARTGTASNSHGPRAVAKRKCDMGTHTFRVLIFVRFIRRPPVHRVLSHGLKRGQLARRRAASRGDQKAGERARGASVATSSSGRTATRVAGSARRHVRGATHYVCGRAPAPARVLLPVARARGRDADRRDARGRELNVKVDARDARALRAAVRHPGRSPRRRHRSRAAPAHRAPRRARRAVVCGPEMVRTPAHPQCPRANGPSYRYSRTKGVIGQKG